MTTVTRTPYDPAKRPLSVPTPTWHRYLDLLDGARRGVLNPDSDQELQRLLRKYRELRELWR